MGKDIEKWDGREPLDVYMAEIEKAIIKNAMIEAGGNVSKGAENLQIKRQTLQHKLKKYEIKP